MAEPLLRAADPDTVDADNPWPGLASFREADRELFFGREVETQELLRLALRERLTVLFGLSGLGKTSLLRAGLFPLLRQENILPVYLRLDLSESEGARRTLTGQVRQAIVQEATEAGIEIPAFSEAETLWESLHRQGAELWSPRNRIVTPLLVFDQFEEVFTLGRRNAARAQEAEAFLTELADLCEGSVPASLRERLEADPAATREFSFTRHPYKILLSLREDFLPELEGLRGRIRSIVHNRFRLRRMNGDNALRVITQAGGHLVEPDVPAKIVHFVAGRETEEIPLAELEIEPALLSVVCRELNNKRRAQGMPRITADLVRGNRDEILSDLYERSVGDLGPDIRSFIEERLLTKSGFRDSVALENAVEQPGVTREALDTLTDRRLLRIEDRGGMQRLELTHDVLTGVIRRSRDRRREEEARESEKAVRREAERKLRRNRRVLLLLAVVLLGVIALAGWGLDAERKASKALAGACVGRASNLRDSNPAQALAYLAQAIREEPESLPAQNLLIDLLLYESWPRPVKELRRGDAEWVQLSEDGRLFAAASDGGERVRFWDTRTLRKLGQVQQPDAINSIQISQDGRRLLIVSPGTAQLWDTGTSEPLWHTDLQQEAIPRLSLDGRWLAWVRDQKTLGVRDNNTQREHTINTSLLTQFGFSPDSRKIFAVDFMDEVFFWDAESGESLPAPRARATADLVFSPDSRHLLVPGFETILWDLEKQTEKQIGEAGRTTVQGWLSPGGARAALQVSEELQVWNLETDSLLMTLPKQDVYGAEFSRDGRRLLTISEEGVELWDIDTGRPVSQALCDCLHGRFVAGTRQIVTGDDSGILRVWRQEPVQTGTVLYRAAGPTPLFSSFSLDGSRLALRTADYRVQLWDTDAVRPLEASIDGVLSHEIKLSQDGRFLYENRRFDYGHRENALHIWDTQTGRPARSPFVWPDRIWDHGYRVDPANEVLGLKSEDNTVQLWSLSTRKPLGEARHRQRVLSFDFTPGGDLVTTSANSLFTWDRTGKSLGPAITQESPVTSFDFSTDGKLLATGTEYGLVRIWDLRSNPVRMLAGPLRHRDKIDFVRFELGDRTLLTRSTNLLRLWDTRTGKPESASLRVEGEIRSAQLGPDGTRILVNTRVVDRKTSRFQENRVLLLDARTGQPLVRTSFPIDSDVQARLSSNGQILWVALGKQVHAFVVPQFPKQDRELLARWAEAVGGWSVGEDGQLVELSDQLARLEALRRETADAPLGQLRAASLIRWFLSDPKTRTASPVFEKTIEHG